MKTRVIMPAIGVMLLTAGCKKELELDYRDIDPVLVVEANLGEGGATAVLTQTTPMDEPMNRTRLTDAVMTLSGADGVNEQLVAGADGVYSAAIVPTPGVSYRLEVERPGGFRAVSECVMQHRATIAEAGFSWISMPYDEVAVLSVYVNDPPERGDAYWLRVFRNGEVYAWVVADDRFALDGRLEMSMMTARRNPTDPDDEANLDDGDVLTISVAAIPPHVYDYLTRLSAHAVAGPTTFTGDFCLGYFLASTPSETSVTFSR